eukprot:668516-Rhodomonas_salina.1
MGPGKEGWDRGGDVGHREEGEENRARYMGHREEGEENRARYMGHREGGEENRARVRGEKTIGPGTWDIGGRGAVWTYGRRRPQAWSGRR